MAISDNDIIKGVVEQTHTVGAMVLNVHYWEAEFASPVDEADVIDELTDELDSIYDTIDQLQVDTHSYDLYRFYVWTGVKWNLIGTGTPTLTTALTDEDVPSGCCMVVRGYTDTSRSLARKFLSGFTEANFSGQDWSSTLQTAAAAYLVAWLSGHYVDANTSYHAGVWSKGVTFIPFNLEGVANAIPGYQRRRKEGVGA